MDILNLKYSIDNQLINYRDKSGNKRIENDFDLDNICSKKSNIPYSEFAYNDTIIYNGVMFICDEDSNSICLGDMSCDKNVITIPLANGGSLKVNRDSIVQLGKALKMFSPEDMKNILIAIAQDKKVNSVKYEIQNEEYDILNDTSNEAKNIDLDVTFFYNKEKFLKRFNF